MFHKKDENHSNFWISYADLMAGLLFVFILLIGAIVSKSIILRSSLTQKEQKLKLATKELEKKSLTLQKAQLQLKKKKSVLEESRKRLIQLERDLEDKKRALLSGNSKIDKQSLIITQKERELEEAQNEIRLRDKEIEELHLLLSQLKAQNSRLSNEMESSKMKFKKLEENKTVISSRLKLKDKEIQRLNELLLTRNTEVDSLNGRLIILQNILEENKKTLKEQKIKLKDYEDKVLILSKELTDKDNILKLKDRNMSDILEALDNQRSKYESLLEKLRSQKAKIKSLTGIKLKVIDELKSTLGDIISVDESGALRLSSKILFDKNSAKLKERAKIELRDIFEKYITSLMQNRAVAPFIDKIIIEGHTDSDGGYLYNLKLSQQRALAVMNYLLSLPISKKYNLKKYLVASGRGYMDRIIKNGVEDKDASRRIEIKFSLKNQEAFYEIERILDEN